MNLGRMVSALWTRSPQQLVAALRRRERQAMAPAPAAIQGYHAWAIDELHAFVASAYPDSVLPRDAFRALVGKYQDPAWLKAANRYIGDLWYLFAPDFQRRLPEYYAQQDFALTMTLLSYAGHGGLLQSNYVRPYEIARQRLGQATVLELGAGIPHGVLWQVHNGSTWISHVTSVDIDGTPKAFFEFFCARHRVPLRSVSATAGTAPDLSSVRGIDFVFAKDVFEHLVDPVRAIEQVLAAAAPRAVLALDLEDKGAVEYQHVSPALQPLAVAVGRAGFALVEKTGNLAVFARE